MCEMFQCNFYSIKEYWRASCVSGRELFMGPKALHFILHFYHLVSSCAGVLVVHQILRCSAFLIEVTLACVKRVLTRSIDNPEPASCNDD